MVRNGIIINFRIPSLAGISQRRPQPPSSFPPSHEACGGNSPLRKWKCICATVNMYSFYGGHQHWNPNCCLELTNSIVIASFPSPDICQSAPRIRKKWWPPAEGKENNLCRLAQLCSMLLRWLTIFTGFFYSQWAEVLAPPPLFLIPNKSDTYFNRTGRLSELPSLIEPNVSTKPLGRTWELWNYPWLHCLVLKLNEQWWKISVSFISRYGCGWTAKGCKMTRKTEYCRFPLTTQKELSKRV